MALKFAIQVASLTTVGLGGWIAGILTERMKLQQSTCDRPDDLLDKLKGMPGLPIFGTVSAASSPENKLSVLGSDLVSFESSPVSSKPSRVSQIMKFGFPGLDTVRSFDDYVLSYDRKNRVPHWVFEHLTKEALVYNESVDRSKCEFTEDTSMHPYFRYR